MGIVRLSSELFIKAMHLDAAGPVELRRAMVVQDGTGVYLDVTLAGDHIPDGDVEATFTRVLEHVTVKFEPR